MTVGELDLFLLASSILCLVMAIFNLARAKSRGLSGYLMCGAFLAVGAALHSYRSGYGQAIFGGFGALAFVFLVGDFMVRAKNKVIEDNRK